uniref:Zinc finger protein 287-like isoform X1 n=1 Tax=Hirondellea gigas TaxID=1518452 RepID=A0A6A7FUX2_9CRUS
MKVYSCNHEVSHRVAGTVLKKKRGRPRKSQMSIVKSRLATAAGNHDDAVDINSSRPRRRTVMPSRFRDSVAGDALETLVMGRASSPSIAGAQQYIVPEVLPSVALGDPLNVDGLAGEPSIVVVGDGSELPQDLPISLNIEILEQDGNFILRGIEHLGDIKQIEAVKNAQQQRLQQGFILNQHGVSVVQEDSALPSQTYLIDSSDPHVQKIDLNDIKLNHFEDAASITILETDNLPKSYLNEQNITDSSFHDQQTIDLISSSNVKNQQQIHRQQILPQQQENQHLPEQHQQQQQDVKVAQVSATESSSSRVATTARRKRGPRKKARFKCQICGNSFLRKGRYSHHMFLHGSVVVQCVQCKERFGDQEQLAQHQQQTQHQGIGIVELFNGGTDAPVSAELRCNVCPNRTFISSDGLEKHMSTLHEGADKPICCDYCNKRFVYQHSLRLHVQQCHQNTQEVLGNKGAQIEREYPCEVCGKVFNHPSSLTYHVDTSHNKNRFFVCAICEASFKHKQLLQRHYSVHSNDRPYVCNICKKSFKTRCNLANHSVVHSQKKKYTCELCGKQFNHLTSITLHVRSHTGEKPFSCPVCNKKFAQSGNLQEHVRIHTGEKPFACGVCEKRFTTSSQVRFHARIHTKKPNGIITKDRKTSKVKINNVIPITSNENVITTGNVGAADATGFFTSICSQCYVPLPDNDSIRNHRCSVNNVVNVQQHQLESQNQQQLLSTDTHTWLVSGPANDGSSNHNDNNNSNTLNTVSLHEGLEAVNATFVTTTNADGGGGTGISVDAGDGTENIIYILAENKHEVTVEGHAYNALQQGSVQLLDATSLAQDDNSQQQQITLHSVEQSWSTTANLELYDSGAASNTLCDVDPASAAAALLPSLVGTDAQQVTVHKQHLL